MFENIIGHADTVAHLKNVIARDQLPQAVLISGNRYSGKLTLGLEIARSITCAVDGAPWGCRCSACEQHRRLSHPQLLMMGHHSFEEELEAAKQAVLAQPGKATCYLYGRAVKKLLNRFHPVLWEGEEKRLSNAASSIESAAELVEEVLPQSVDADIIDSVKLAKTIEALSKKTAAILAKTPRDLLHVESIRRMNFWVRMSSQSAAKVIILEHVETLNDSQRNLLLKILEEPPANVFFLLTTSKRTAILPTILSRVRTVQLQPRTIEQEEEVLRRIFWHKEVRSDAVGGVRPLTAFFRSVVCSSMPELDSAADRWAQHLMGLRVHTGSIPEEDMPGIASTTGADQRAAGVMLLRLIVEALRRRILEGLATSAPDIAAVVRIRKVVADIDRAVHAVQELNINAVQVLESLWFREDAAV